MLDQFRQLGYPEIAAVPDSVHRPIWSVMIPTYNWLVLLRETLKGVLAQDPGPDRMQIEVMDDASTKDDPEAVVHERAGAALRFTVIPRTWGRRRILTPVYLGPAVTSCRSSMGMTLSCRGFYQRMGELF